MDIFIWSILIFIAITVAVSIGTVRILLMVRGKKLLSISIGFIEACIGIAAISKIIKDISGTYSILAYGAGFAAGLFVGMLISEKISKNVVSINIFSKGHYDKIENFLRENGYGVTSFHGNGKDGNLKILNVICKNTQIKELNTLICKIDPKAFIVTYKLENFRGGFVYNLR